MLRVSAIWNAWLPPAVTARVAVAVPRARALQLEVPGVRPPDPCGCADPSRRPARVLAPRVVSSSPAASPSPPLVVPRPGNWPLAAAERGWRRPGHGGVRSEPWTSCSGRSTASWGASDGAQRRMANDMTGPHETRVGPIQAAGPEGGWLCREPHAHALGRRHATRSRPLTTPEALRRTVGAGHPYKTSIRSSN